MTRRDHQLDSAPYVRRARLLREEVEARRRAARLGAADPLDVAALTGAIETLEAVLAHHRARSAARVTRADRLRSALRAATRVLSGRRDSPGDAASAASPASVADHDVLIVVDPAASPARSEDLEIARGLHDAFARLGRSPATVTADTLPGALHPGVRLLLTLAPGADARLAPRGCWTVGWIWSWPGRWLANPSLPVLDVVLASSAAVADAVAARSDHDPIVMPLASGEASDRDRPRDLACLVVLDRSVGVTSPPAGLEARSDVVLAGEGWAGAPIRASQWLGPVGETGVAGLLDRARIVVDVGAPETAPGLGGRVFAALSRGALVITDNRAGSKEVFGGLLPSFASPAELDALLERYLGDEPARVELVSRLSAMVRDAHRYDHRVAEIERVVEGLARRPRITIQTCPPDREVAPFWGDTYLARGLARSFRRRGWAASIRIRPDWQLAETDQPDVLLHLRGRFACTPRPGPLNVLWIISHPADVTDKECEAFDVVLAASTPFAAELSGRVDRPVHALLQAADTERFKPCPADDTLRAGLLFVGNSRGRHRDVVRWAVELGHGLHVYGRQWERFVDPLYVRGEFFPNDRLARLYVSADIVLNDHWPDMRERGFISNRIFDVLACGGFVISDDVPGLAELFDGAVPTFHTREELAGLIERYGGSADRRRELAERGMAIVRERHGLEHRVDELIELITPLLRQRGPRRTGAPLE